MRSLRVGVMVAVVLLQVLLARGRLSAQVSFDTAVNYPAGTGAVSVAVGDFDRDGRLDLVVANQGTLPNYTDGGVSVLLGNGDGTFQPAQNFAAGTRPYSVAVGDFNGDGIPDLAVANFTAPFGTVTVLLGNGDGSFRMAGNVGVGVRPAFVTVGDFNRDGKLDLVVANSSSSNVAVLLGHGDGSFDTAGNFDVGPDPESVAVADFNGDAIQDLAVTNSGGVSVLLGNGDGTFQTAQHFSAGPTPSSVATADLNGDGKLDLAAANATFPTGAVYVLLGRGDGTFQSAGNFPVGSTSNSIAVGDFNSDGVPDLATANSNSNNVSALLGNGDGTFQPQLPFPVGMGSSPQSVAVADFNGDGKPDLVVISTGLNRVSVLINTTPSIITEFAIPTPDSGPLGIIVLSSSSRLWFTEFSANNISGITTEGFFIGEFALCNPPDPLCNPGPREIEGAGGNCFWFTEFFGVEFSGGSIGDICTDGSVGSYDLPTPGSRPVGLPHEDFGRPVVTEALGNNLAHLNDDDVFVEIPIPTPNSGPLGITCPPFEDRCWFTEAGVGVHQIGLMTMGRVIEFPIPSGGTPQEITNLAGNLWFTEVSVAGVDGNDRVARMNADGVVTGEFAIPTPNSQPFGIVAGPDGNIWFTEIRGNKIGRLNISTGLITEFPIPTPDSQPFYLTVGPDNNIWFTEFKGNKIGRLVPPAP